jgi:small-conductance mechanosensitive channel
MLDTRSPIFGVSAVALGSALVAVVLLAAAHVGLRSYIKRRTQREQEQSSHQHKPPYWLARGLKEALAPLALLLWIHAFHFATSNFIADLTSPSFGAEAQETFDFLRSVGTIAALAWLLSRIARTIDALLMSFSARTLNAWDDVVAPFAGRATRLVLPLLAVILGAPTLTMAPALKDIVQHAVSMLIIGAIAALLIQLIDVVSTLVLKRQQMTQADNRRARAIYTQVTVLRKIVTAIVALLAIAAMLMVFDSVRQFGTALMASAGVAGLIVGFAAQKSIATLLAGFQIAITQPIRLDDVVIVENEWGTIEEITLTYVVVRIWDLRRLILPITYFIEKPFQNWTRMSAEILGTVFFYLDYKVPMAALREEFQRVLKASTLWNQKVAVLQMTDSKERVVEIRALMSARDASTAFDLRCEVREKLVDYLQRHFPESLPRVRADIAAPASIAAVATSIDRQS